MYKNAMQDLQRFMIDTRYAFPKFDGIQAILAASRINNITIDSNITKVGKLRQIKISHFPVDCDAVAADCTGNVCDDGEVQEPVQELFLIDDCIASKVFSINMDDLRLIDGNYNFSDIAKALIRSKLGSITKELDDRLLAKVIAHRGLHMDGNPYNAAQITDTATGVMQPIGAWGIEEEFSRGGYQTPFIIGGKDMFLWKKAQAIATENNTTGQDYAKIGSANWYYDQEVDNVTGSTAATGGQLLAFDADAIEFVTYNENVGMFATDLASVDDMEALFNQSKDYIFGILTEPNTGLTWDLDIKFKDCTKKWNLQFKLRWDIFFPKIESCNGQGINGIMVYTTCPYVLAPCPTGTAPSPVANTHLYSWTPGASYPFTLADAVIGGVHTQPNVVITNIADLVAAMNDSYGSQTFTVSGANIQYTGYSKITGTLNTGQYNLNFA